MLLWVILGFGWLGVLAAAVSLFRLADYADKKMRTLVQQRPRRRDQAPGQAPKIAA